MTRAKWNVNQEQTLIYTLLDEARAGRMSHGGFKKDTWEKVQGILNTKYGTVYDMDQMKSKFSTMKLDYRTFAKLKLSSGFGWDSRKETVTAPDDVWDSYIQEHPNAANFRHKTLPFFEELDELFFKSTATGEFALPPPSLPRIQPGSRPNP
ncbi:hypothetical protein NEOLI_000490 [Neolecta irregularis DAH-3]|uniref:Myb/SANT-like domain-containing protein n=1 Tax=Neolecta irregularis (strain DAH-3) TaxID=1198029 RepID=A0A1U7LU29_NEOID|nr:hypothetical protein NEOLI_000490 [Neolecta irregularis DAH-3]|eukprot:OLL26083.1 hypothetical protein NEOLI_000490 [Neolecta irregularis DAH-3]